MAAEIRMVVHDEVYCVGTTEKLLVVVWRGKPTLDRVDRSMAAMDPSKLAAFLGIVEEGSPIPDSDVRKRAEEIQRGITTGVRATVIEGTGLLSSLSRTTIRGLFALARTPVRIGATVADVASTVGPAVGMSAADVVESVRSFRARYAATLTARP